MAGMSDGLSFTNAAEYAEMIDGWEFIDDAIAVYDAPV